MEDRQIQLPLDSRVEFIKLVLNPSTEKILVMSKLKHDRFIWSFLYYRYLRIILQNAFYVDCRISITAWVDQFNLVMNLRNAVCQACSILGFVLYRENLAFKTNFWLILPVDCKSETIVRESKKTVRVVRWLNFRHLRLHPAAGIIACPRTAQFRLQRGRAKCVSVVFPVWLRRINHRRLVAAVQLELERECFRFRSGRVCKHTRHSHLIDSLLEQLGRGIRLLLAMSDASPAHYFVNRVYTELQPGRQRLTWCFRHVTPVRIVTAMGRFSDPIGTKA